jgi:hypothetical protein
MLSTLARFVARLPYIHQARVNMQVIGMSSALAASHCHNHRLASLKRLSFEALCSIVAATAASLSLSGGVLANTTRAADILARSAKMLLFEASHGSDALTTIASMDSIRLCLHTLDHHCARTSAPGGEHDLKGMDSGRCGGCGSVGGWEWWHRQGVMHRPQDTSVNSRVSSGLCGERGGKRGGGGGGDEEQAVHACALWQVVAMVKEQAGHLRWEIRHASVMLAAALLQSHSLAA